MRADRSAEPAADVKVTTPPVRTSGRRVAAALLVGLVIAPIVVRDAFLIDRLGVLLLFGLVAVSLDLMWGHGGMLSLGHAVLVGGAGYVVAVLLSGRIFATVFPLLPAIAVAVLVAACLSAAMVSLGFRGRRPLGALEFALLTLAVGLLAERVASTSRFLGGQNGILIAERLMVAGRDLHRGHSFYLLAAVVLVGGILVTQAFLRSRVGLVLRAARDDPEMVELFGHDVARARTFAGAIAGGLAGLSGSIIHVHEAIVSPGSMSLSVSTIILVWVIIGGRGSLVGPALAAVLLQSASIALSGTLMASWLLLLGVILITVVTVLPRGLYGALCDLAALFHVAGDAIRRRTRRPAIR